MPVAGGSSERNACKSEACAIQECISKSGYDASRCQRQIDALKKCCERYQGVSIHCGFDPQTKSSETGDPADQTLHGR